MDNLAKFAPILAVTALVFGLIGLILGIVAFQKASQLDAVGDIKDANSTISESVAGLQEEMSGLSKKYVTMTNLKEFANSTQEAFNQITEQLTKIRTQSRTDTIKIAELETRLGGGTVSRSVAPVSSTTSSGTNESSGGTTSSTVLAGGSTDYVIQSGDTLAKVAKSFGVNLEKLISANPDVQPRYLRVGQKIVIPAQ
ncbi:MAG: hypothetical protein CMI18_03540 [Opitutaceae bacterium]|nr:hypothetical protein [Opitutaceae bacterium]|tara:strand:+ start:9214 stop:9807 length:594 start_codon:yes stop_codon:yes gene_type:complete